MYSNMPADQAIVVGEHLCCATHSWPLKSLSHVGYSRASRVAYTWSARSERPRQRRTLQTGQRSARALQPAHMRWPLPHWWAGGGMVSRHTGHSRAPRMVPRQDDRRFRDTGIGPQHSACNQRVTPRYCPVLGRGGQSSRDGKVLDNVLSLHSPLGHSCRPRHSSTRAARRCRAASGPWRRSRQSSGPRHLRRLPPGRSHPPVT